MRPAQIRIFPNSFDAYAPKRRMSEAAASQKQTLAGRNLLAKRKPNAKLARVTKDSPSQPMAFLMCFHIPWAL
jgi:hypothetical protein